MRHILKCTGCGNYTMKEDCRCGSKAFSPKPMKYSPMDKFADYRRKAKEDEYKKRGLI
jgi:rRNA maturation protein Nop10